MSWYVESSPHIFKRVLASIHPSTASAMKAKQYPAETAVVVTSSVTVGQDQANFFVTLIACERVRVRSDT
jgi:hypothetical protein